jgi:hypothetical protein
MRVLAHLQIQLLSEEIFQASGVLFRAFRKPVLDGGCGVDVDLA